MQAQHIDTEFYDAHFDNYVYLDAYAQHLARWQVLGTELLGVKRVPIRYTIVGPVNSVFIQNIMDIAVEPAGGSTPLREMVIANTRHACGPGLPVVRGVRGTFHDYGYAWDNAGKNGHDKLIEWRAS